MYTKFGTGRFIVIFLYLWFLGCILTRFGSTLTPLKVFALYVVNTVLISGIFPNVQFGNIAASIADKGLRYIGSSGLLFVAISLDIIPFMGTIEEYTKLALPKIQKYIKSFKPVRRNNRTASGQQPRTLFGQSSGHTSDRSRTPLEHQTEQMRDSQKR